MRRIFLSNSCCKISLLILLGAKLCYGIDTEVVNTDRAILSDKLPDQRTWRELDCIRHRYERTEKPSPYSKDSSILGKGKNKLRQLRDPLHIRKHLISKLAPSIHKHFEEDKMGPVERAIFYANMMTETDFLHLLTERGSGSDRYWRGVKKPKIDSKDCWDDAVKTLNSNIACAKMEKCATNDDKFFDCRYFPSAVVSEDLRKSKNCEITVNLPRAGQTKERYGATWRGVGLKQLTWCYNHVSYWHRKVHKMANKKISKRFDIPRHCTLNKIKEIESRYKNEFGLDLDPYGVLKNPKLLANFCDKLKAKNNPPLEVSDVLVDNSFDFLKNGNCKSANKNIKNMITTGHFDKDKLTDHLKKKYSNIDPQTLKEIDNQCQYRTRKKPPEQVAKGILDEILLAGQHGGSVGKEVAKYPGIQTKILINETIEEKRWREKLKNRASSTMDICRLEKVFRFRKKQENYKKIPEEIAVDKMFKCVLGVVQESRKSNLIDTLSCVEGL